MLINRAKLAAIGARSALFWVIPFKRWAILGRQSSGPDLLRFWAPGRGKPPDPGLLRLWEALQE